MPWPRGCSARRLFTPTRAAFAPPPRHTNRPSHQEQVPGRTFPVDVIHALEDHSGEYAAAAVDTAIDIHCNQPEGERGEGGQGSWVDGGGCCARKTAARCLLSAPSHTPASHMPASSLVPLPRFPPPAGDILVFLTGQAEIDKAVKALNDAGWWAGC